MRFEEKLRTVLNELDLIHTEVHECGYGEVEITSRVNGFEDFGICFGVDNATCRELAELHLCELLIKEFLPFTKKLIEG